MILRRVAIAAMAAAVFASPACVAGDIATDLPQRVDETGEPIEGPEIDLFVRAHGADAIAVYLEGRGADARRIAEATAAWLGFEGEIAHEDPFYEDVVLIELDRRLLEPGGDDRWVLDLDASGLASLLRTAGYPEAVLVVCTPAVETRLRATRGPDVEAVSICNLNGGGGWTIFSDDEPLRARFTFVPEPAHYLAYAAATLLGTVVFGALAWWLGRLLREKSFPRRSAASVAIGLVGGGFATVGLAAVTAALGATVGPADNLALSRDLAVGGFVQSVLYPALIATAPGIIFATMLIRQGPLSEQEMLPTVAPPGLPGPPAPPPVPWSGG